MQLVRGEQRARATVCSMDLHDGFAYGMVGVTGVRPMSTKTFNKLKGTLLPKLRERTDPPPRRMRAGEGARASWFANLRDEIALTGGAVVRGFKLCKLRVDPALWSDPVWLATAHVVVATVSPSGTTVYTDPNAQVDGTTEYIFVPTARAHRELADEQLLSGEWHLGSVVGGDVCFQARFLSHEMLQGRARSVVNVSPEKLVAKPRVLVRLPPHYAEWFRVNKIDTSLTELAEMMGAPVFPCNEDFPADDDVDALAQYAAVKRNEEACVGGLDGLQLELYCREKLLRGELSIARARRLFFNYFDTTYERVKLTQTRRFAEWCKLWNQPPPGGL